MMQVPIAITSSDPFDVMDGKKQFVYLRTERGGSMQVGDTLLLCDDCGADIEEGETYYNLGYPPWNAICEDCVIRAETVRGDESNYKIVSSEQILPKPEKTKKPR